MHTFACNLALLAPVSDKTGLTVCGMWGAQLIVLSFTLIIALMIGTFTVVYKVGGIRFNE